MSKRLPLGVVLLLSCGCATATETGAAVGGVGGALVGTGIGAATGHPLLGAALGGATGAAAGGLIGNATDREERREARAAAIAAANARPPLTLPDVVKMTHEHVSDALIIREIRETNSVYGLSADDIIWLKQQGVSDVVVMEMQSRRPGMIYPPPYGRPVYIVDPPPPPVSVGVGFGWGGGRCWR